MQPLDLTEAPPRSPKVILDGLPMLARTIDKMRACLPGGNPGEYRVDGMSERMLTILGVDPGALQAEVARVSTDDEVAAWMRTHADTSKYAEAADVMLNRSVDDIDPDRLAKFAEKYPHYEKVGSRKLSDIIEADDAEMFASKRS